jgi:hypothetical protein
MRYHGGLTRLAGMLAAGILVLGGCGGGQNVGEKTPSTTAAATGESEGGGAAAGSAAARLGGPAATVYVFLEGARSGDDQKVTSMLTPLARQELAKMNLSVAPPCSDTAQFEVGEVRYPSEDVAHVASRWTEVDLKTSQPQPVDMTWVLRKEPEGWRVGGMAMSVFEGEAPLLLNFEKPDDMIRQRQMLKAEIARRAQQTQSPAAVAEKQDDSAQR